MGVRSLQNCLFLHFQMAFYKISKARNGTIWEKIEEQRNHYVFCVFFQFYLCVCVLRINSPPKKHLSYFFSIREIGYFLNKPVLISVKVYCVHTWCVG
jgi:hypothetical protein